MIYIAIVGGGPAGLACAQTLAATRGLEGHPQNLQIDLYDKPSSDLNLAELWCVPGLRPGTPGTDWLAQASHDVLRFGNVERKDVQVLGISGSAPNIQVRTEKGVEEYHYVVYAPGRHVEAIIEGAELYPHPRTVKDWKAVRVDGQSRVRPGVFVAGIAAGNYSMLGSVMGSGTDVAGHILSEIEGHPAVVHDVKGGRVKRE